MKDVNRYLAVFFAAGVLFACASLAQSPFDGTWKTDLSKIKQDTKPIVFYLAQGWYHCESCTPTYAIKADRKIALLATKVPGKLAKRWRERPDIRGASPPMNSRFQVGCT